MLLILFTAIFLIPFYFIIITAFKSGQDLTVNPIGLPAQYHVENFRAVFEGTGVLRAILNSLIISACTIGIGLLVYMPASFGIYRMRGHSLGIVIYSVILFGLMIPAVGYWQLILLFRDLHLYNNLLGVILSFVGSQLPFCTLLIVGYMKSIPPDLVDSAEIDSASDFQLFRHIIVPLSRPIILTVVIFLLVESWNNFITPLLLLRDDSLLTLPLKLKNAFYTEYAPKYELFFAGALITAIPFIVAYVSLQKYFVYGLGGALKE